MALLIGKLTMILFLLFLLATRHCLSGPVAIVDESLEIELQNITLYNGTAGIDVRISYSESVANVIDINQTEIVVRNESSVILVYDLVSSLFTTSSDYLIEFQDLPSDTLCFLELTNTTASAGEDEGAEMPDVLLLIKFPTTHVWTLLSSQTKQCVIKFTCIFSLGSDAEGCLVQWRTLDSVTTIGEAFIPRIGSEQSIMITILNDLKPGIVYMADAVGVRNDQLTDNERATRIFQVVQDCSTSITEGPSSSLPTVTNQDENTFLLTIMGLVVGLVSFLGFVCITVTLILIFLTSKRKATKSLHHGIKSRYHYEDKIPSCVSLPESNMITNVQFQMKDDEIYDTITDNLYEIIKADQTESSLAEVTSSSNEIPLHSPSTLTSFGWSEQKSSLQTFDESIPKRNVACQKMKILPLYPRHTSSDTDSDIAGNPMENIQRVRINFESNAALDSSGECSQSTEQNMHFRENLMKERDTLKRLLFQHHTLENMQKLPPESYEMNRHTSDEEHFVMAPNIAYASLKSTISHTSLTDTCTFEEDIQAVNPNIDS